MNRVYRLIWSSRPGGLKVIPAVLLCAVSLAAQALPQGGTVSQGTGSVKAEGNVMTVTQGSQNMVLEWQRFNTSGVESLVFIQPNAQAIALNRVIGTESSTLLGSLTANGQVWILNPNGVLIGQGARVNVGGLLTSSLFISDADFMSGKRVFRGSGGSVINRGTITAGTNGEGGYVALMGGTVSNEGVITARLGTVALASGSQVTLDFNGDKLLNAQVDKGLVNALAQNRQLISANGGTVIMTAHGADALLKTVVNNEGTIEARTLGGIKGRMVLKGGPVGDAVSVSGKLDAAGESGAAGGLIALSGPTVKIADGTVITTAADGGATGNLQITAKAFTVTAPGANAASGMSATTLSNHLALNNVSIKTAAFDGSGTGDIDVNAPLTWASDNTLAFDAYGHVNLNAPVTTTGATAALALKAARNININADMSATGATARLTMTPGTNAGDGYQLKNGARINLQSGANLVIAGKTYKVINGLTALQSMQDKLGDNYALGSDIDASATQTANDGAGFSPIGTAIFPFTGVLDGLGHQISGLTINRPATSYVGLIGFHRGTVQNIGLAGVNIKGGEFTGALVGYNVQGAVVNATASGTLSGSVGGTGGLVGFNYAGRISNVVADVAVTGTLEYTGGLLGINLEGELLNATARGTVEGESYTGGLVGLNARSTITNASASGTVKGTEGVGGLVGQNSENSRISFAYATGAVTGTESAVGGLVGRNGLATISNAYASGTVNNVALTNDTMIGSSAQSTLDEVVALSAADINRQGSFKNFDFANTWRIYEGNTAPLLRALLKPITVTAGNASKTYDGKIYTDPLTGISYSLAGVNLDGTLIYGSAAQPAIDAGTYGLSGLWSTSYDISYGSGSLTINPRELITETAVKPIKTYDGTNVARVALAELALGEVPLSGFADGESIVVKNRNLDGVYNSKNVREATTVEVTMEADNFAAAPGTKLSNYRLMVEGEIIPAPLTVKANDVAKVYDGVAHSGATALTYLGLVNGETEASAVTLDMLTFSGSAQGAKNAGNYSIVPGGLSAANYTIGYEAGTYMISPMPLTLSLSALPGKVYDGTSNAALVLADLTPGGVVAGESVSAKSLQLSGLYNSKNVNEAKTVSVALNDSNFTAGSGTQLSNYQINAVKGEITRAPLSIRANDAAKKFDGTAYSGGNGLTYRGFVGGESVAVLLGTPSYAGTSQGATRPGSYSIVPEGLTAANYKIGFVAGTLTIAPIIFNASMTGISPQALLGQRRLPRFTSDRLRLADPRRPLQGTECKKLVKRGAATPCVGTVTPPVSRLLPAPDTVLSLAGNACPSCARKPSQP